MAKLGTIAFNEACQRIVIAAKESYPEGMIQYAANYARIGMSMTDREEIRTQALYILNNLRHWRGEEAKMVKETIKAFAEETV